MKKRLYGALAALLASSGLVHGQGYYPQYAPPPVYGTPYYPAPGAHPGMPMAPGMSAPAGMQMPGYPSGVGRATVGEVPSPVQSIPEGMPASMENPLIIKELPASPAGAKAPPTTSARPVSVPVSRPQENFAPPAVIPASHRKARAPSPSGPGCDSCGVPIPCMPICGMPMMCEVNCHGQPIIERELDRQPRGYHAYARLDYLFWDVDNQESPTLLQYSSPQGVVPIGAGDLDNGERTGARATVGFWLDSCQKVGLEGTFLWLADRTPGFATSNPTTRPFVNAVTGLPSQFVLFGPGVSGSAEASTSFRFHTAELNLRKELCRFCCGHLDLIGGYRYLHLDEGLNVNTTQTFAGGSLRTSDQFAASNHFHGVQIGLDGEINWGSLYLNPWGKIAAGHNNQFVTINGGRVGTGPGGVAAAPGGFLALPSNIGTDRDGAICFVPEFGLNLGYKVTANCRFLVGYSAMFLTSAVRPSDQVSANLNLSQLQAPGGPPAAPVGPLAPFRPGLAESDFLAQGVNVSVEIRW